MFSVWSAALTIGALFSMYITSPEFSSNSAAELDADTGDVVYVENRAPITRASDQTENVKLVIEF